MQIGMFFTMLLFISTVAEVSPRPTFSYLSIFRYSGNLYCALWYGSGPTIECTNTSISWSKSSSLASSNPIAAPITAPIQIDGVKYIQGVNERDNVCRVTLITTNISSSDGGVYTYKHVDSEINGIYGGMWYDV